MGGALLRAWNCAEATYRHRVTSAKRPDEHQTINAAPWIRMSISMPRRKGTHMKVENKSVTLRGWDAVIAMAGVLLTEMSNAELLRFVALDIGKASEK